MVKVLTDIYNNGEGFYMDGYLQANLDVLARAVAKDNFFTILIFSSDGVRTGKSVFAQQVGAYLVHTANKLNGWNNTIDVNNIHYTANELMAKALSCNKGACNILDEDDDITGGFWSKQNKDLRRFFKKAGQLNQFVILISPEFFGLPPSFVYSYPTCAIDVKYLSNTEFERGEFRFFSYEKKNKLYTFGKKNRDFMATVPDFRGRFLNFYPFGMEAYKEKKRADLQRLESKEETGFRRTISEVAYNNLCKNLKLSGFTNEKIAELTEVAEPMAINKRIWRTKKDDFAKLSEQRLKDLVVPYSLVTPNLNKNLSKNNLEAVEVAPSA